MNMEIVYGVLIAVVALAGVIFIPEYLKRKKITSVQVRGIKKYIEVAGLVLDSLELTERVKDRDKFILDLADSAIDHVAKLIDGEGDKAETVYKVLNEVLRQMGISLTEKQRLLVDRVIAEGLDYFKVK